MTTLAARASAPRRPAAAPSLHVERLASAPVAAAVAAAARVRPLRAPSSAARPAVVAAALRRPPVADPSAAPVPDASDSPHAYPQALLDKYEPEPCGILGRGSFGVVVAARARAQKGTPSAPPARVAIKILAKHPGARVPGAPVPEPGRVAARIAREIHALGALSCPECVELLGVYESDTHAYLVTEMMAGGDLDAALRCAPARALPAPVLAAIAHDVLQVLTECHAAGLVYGDFKPANILLASTPDSWDAATGGGVAARLADFGCASRVGDGAPASPSTSGSGPTTGTPLYLAPEAMILSQNGPKVDVWGVGAVLYLALTGRPPFPAPRRGPGGAWAHPPNEISTVPAPPLSPGELFAAIMSDDIAFDGHPALDANPAAAAFLRRLLARDWDERPTAAEALADPWLAGVREARAGPRAVAAAARAERAAARAAAGA